MRGTSNKLHSSLTCDTSVDITIVPEQVYYVSKIFSISYILGIKHQITSMVIFCKAKILLIKYAHILKNKI